MAEKTFNHDAFREGILSKDVRHYKGKDSLRGMLFKLFSEIHKQGSASGAVSIENGSLKFADVQDADFRKLTGLLKIIKKKLSQADVIVVEKRFILQKTSRKRMEPAIRPAFAVEAHGLKRYCGNYHDVPATANCCSRCGSTDIVTEPPVVQNVIIPRRELCIKHPDLPRYI